MQQIDLEELNEQSDRMLEKWKRASGDRIFLMDESSFEYGFELGWRIAKGEVID